MAARLNPLHQTAIREKIRADHLVQWLQDHVLAGKKARGTQIRAALGLLAKCIPDLRAMEHSGELTHTHVSQLSDEALANIATGGRTRAIKAPPSAPDPSELH